MLTLLTSFGLLAAVPADDCAGRAARCDDSRPAASALARIDSLLARDSLPAAARLADSLLRSGMAEPARLGHVAALFGRFDAAALAFGGLDPVPGTTLALLQLAAGVVPADLDDLEARLLGGAPTDWRLRSGRGSALRALTELGFHLRGTGPGLVATAEDPSTLLLVYQAARDTAGVREQLAAADAAWRGLSRRNVPAPLLLAEAELFLGDSAAALRRLRAFDREWSAMDRGVMWGMVGNAWTLGRAWRLLGDLEAAAGRPADAARAWRRVDELWDGGDPAVREAVGAVRAALGAGAAAVTPSLPVFLRASQTGFSERYRYDAVAWMRLPFQPDWDRPLVAARLTLLATERATRSAGGVITYRQTYDSTALALPALGNAGDIRLSLLRESLGALAGLRAVTEADERGRVLRRSVSGRAALPAELERALLGAAGFGPLGAAVPFPAAAVGVGAAWTDSLSVYVPGGLLDDGARIAATYTLRRVALIGGVRTAFITVDASTGERPTADGGRVSATLTGELVWDVDAGVAVRLAASLRATAWDRRGVATPARVLMTALRQPAPATDLRAAVALAR